jgi:EAL domain-containing protein (putative c-di-GMP-specific phosphodiesterase class I)
VAERSIQVHYQPILDATTGKWAGVDALARWHDPTLGPVEPGTFIPLAEEMGLISELGAQVLETALRQLAEWEQAGLPLTLSLNVSLRQLFKPDFLPHLKALIDRFQLNPARLIVEMTESQPLLGLESEAQRLEELAACGVQLSIDDFGRGHPSLSNLHEMPVHELKSDMQFVRNLRSEKGRHMARAIGDMARALGLRTVAEGVETVEEASVLRRMGVDRLQGYYFARPMPAAEVGIRLRSQPPVIS